MKDNEDRVLEALFAAEPLADDGFSERVVARVRRRLWLRRLALPSAVLGGLAIAFRPALDVSRALGGLLPQLPLEQVPMGDWLRSLLALAPQTMAVTGLTIGILALMVVLPAFED